MLVPSKGQKEESLRGSTGLHSRVGGLMFGTNDRETSVGLGEITSVIFGKQASSDVAEFAPNTLIQHFEGRTGQLERRT